MKKANGYLEGNGYIVTWVFGHLFTLCDIEEYVPSPTGRWSMDNIPCFPEKFKFEIKKDKDKKTDSGAKRQFELIKSLVKREDVDLVVNAGDSDREGEIIIRICVGKTGKLDKGFKRLWLPDQTPETIRTALSEMKDETEYENLANEGFARMYIDWLYGVNLTRFATLKSGTLLRVGRVIVPIVKAIYDRDMAIRNFKPEKYYAIISKAKTNGEEIELISKKKFKNNELDDAKKLCDLYNGTKALVVDVKKKKETVNPGKLYSLTKLQNVLSKKYKMSMTESLNIVQGLYEKGYVTYPRTNSEYLATAEQDKVKKILKAVSGLGYPVEFKFKKTIFDDAKIESHSALTPTYKIPDKTKLSEKEFMVYGTIMRRFVAVFCSEPCIAQKTDIKIKLGDLEEFSLKGTIMEQPGWTKYDDYNKKDKILPNLVVGDEVNTDFKPTEKETTPPKHYTVETLNNYLKNPFREEKANVETESDEEEYKAIFEGLELGTEATRTGIIDNARKSLYIELKKDVYKILPGGENLIESLGRMNISMDKYKTAEVGKALKKVYRGEFSIGDSIKIARGEIEEVFKQKEGVSPETDTYDGFAGDVVGKCPVCGKDVVKGRYNYGCMGYKEGCKFRINTVICNRVISISNARKILEEGKSAKIQGFISPRTGKSFDAVLKLENNEVKFDFN